MEKAQAINKIKTNLCKEKLQFINETYIEDVKLALKKELS